MNCNMKGMIKFKQQENSIFIKAIFCCHTHTHIHHKRKDNCLKFHGLLSQMCELYYRLKLNDSYGNS